jgi:Multiubiquitin
VDTPSLDEADKDTHVDGAHAHVEIIINAERHRVPGGHITFEVVADLAYNGNPPSGPNVVITITYSKGEHDKQGSLLPGGSVKVKEGMVFNVRATDRS